MHYLDYKATNAVVIEQPHDVSFREVKLKKLTEKAVICQVKFSAISPKTDLGMYCGALPAESRRYPFIPGRESAGLIVAKGTDTPKNPEVGDRVMIPEGGFYEDVSTLWGGGSEFAVKDEAASADCIKLPNNVTYEQTVLAHFAAIPCEDIRKMTFHIKDTAVVIGAGMVGISAIQELKISEPDLQVICVEKNPFRRCVAEIYADIVVSPEQAATVIREATNGKMADYILECSGNPEAVEQLRQYIKDGDGVPTQIYLQSDYSEEVQLADAKNQLMKESDVSIFSDASLKSKEQVLLWIAQRKLDTAKLPFEVWPVSEVAKAFAHLEKAGEYCFKLLLDWDR